MSDLRTAAQQALGYMDSVGQQDMYPEEWAVAEALRAALERSDRREWQGLTDTEIGMEYVKWDATPGASMADFARAIEAALKEKNK